MDMRDEFINRHAAIVTLCWAASVGLYAVQSSADASDLCLEAAQDAAEISGVPVSILIAVALTETGQARNGETLPWPWTVNLEGKGYWFEQRSDAERFTREANDRGIVRFDVGCFQVNHRWHGNNFQSIEQMFDPLANATYAASYLRELHETLGDWSTAAGAYHSRNEELASGYRIRFDAFLAALIERELVSSSSDDSPGMARSEESSTLPQRNNFPLLQERDGARTLGSLVTLTSGS
jgi:hypothetical protein